MNRRISLLVAIGFALLLGLGVLVGVVMMTGLKQTVVRAEASQASALAVRAAVRSLRADYLESGDVVSRLLLDPAAGGDDAKRRADANAEEHIASAEAATRRPELKALLGRLRWHDATVTDRIEAELLTLARADPGKARAVYLSPYLRARAVNMALVERGLQLASDEVAAAGALTESEAAATLAAGWATLIAFMVVGLATGLLLGRSVRAVAARFEHAAAEVTQQRDHLQAVMTAMRDALIVVDAAGTITTVNDATCALLGCERRDLVGSPIARHVRSVPAAPAGTGRVPGANPHTVVHRARDGSDVPVSVSDATLRDAGGGVVGAVWVARDMRDDLRLLAEVAAARDAALEGSRIKSEFLANMSHEIRTPMNVIIGYIDIVLEAGELPAAQREYLERVRVASVELLDVINDVLDISKVEAGKLTIERVPFDVRTVVGDVVRTLMLRAREKGLVLALEIDRAIPDRVTGDPLRLRQVMLNLVSNAIKFTDRGEVLIRVGRDEATAALLHFAVRDTGIGIPADKLDVIFQPFTQADGSMSRRYGGTGLGLTIAARLVGMMGGRITVESTVGEGSVFRFTMPTDQEGTGARPDAPASGRERATRRAS